MDERKEDMGTDKVVNKKRLTVEMIELLRKPFPPEAISKIETKTYLSGIKAMYVIERLNDVFGIGRWNYEHEIILKENDQVLIVGQLIILDYDVVVPRQYGSHKTIGKGVELADGYKSAITDGLTKSASYLEIGIDVFKGKVKPPTDNPLPANREEKKNEDSSKILTAEEIEKWNGKIYNGTTVYLNNQAIVISSEGIKMLKQLDKYISF